MSLIKLRMEGMTKKEKFFNNTTDFFFFTFFLLLALGMVIISAYPEEEKAGKAVELMEKNISVGYFEPNVVGIEKIKGGNYWIEAVAAANTFSARIDQSYLIARMIMKKKRFSSVEEIIDFLKKEELGVCRHKAPLAFWFLKSLYPDKEVKLGFGRFYCSNETLGGEDSVSLDINHAWLEADNEIIDVSCVGCEQFCVYQAYAYIEYEFKNITINGEERESWINDATIKTSAIMQAFEDDLSAGKK